MSKSNKFTFNAVPTIRARRTKMDLSFNRKMSASVGKLYPFYVQEVYPGDTFKCKSNFVTRLTSSYIRPVMENVFLDTYYFFVPCRTVFNRWEEVFGENKNGPWAIQEKVNVPGFYEGSITSGSVGDYLGLPLGDYMLYDSDGNSDTYFDPINILPFRCFAKIWNEWFRDENLVDPVNIIMGYDVNDSELPNSNEWSATNYVGQLPKVSKYKDKFTTCLPEPQKGDAIEIGLAGGFLPLTAMGNNLPDAQLTPFDGLPVFGTENAINGGYGLGIAGTSVNGVNGGYLYGDTDFSSDLVGGTTFDIVSSNLGVKAENLGAVTVNEWRYAFALQRMLERDSLFGSRFCEYLLGHFGVSSPDARLQRSEFLGGGHVPLNTQQVAQTTPSSNDPFDSLGSLGAYSLSNSSARFMKGFVEHGFVIGVCCLRYKHSYQQGLEKFWTRIKREDYYDPVFAHIGNTPVYRSELFFDENEPNYKNGVFGYQEAWVDLRYRDNQICGQMRSGVENSLDVYHFADYYQDSPMLNKAFIEETPVYVNRTIAVDSDVQDQFIFDIYHQVEAIRPLPLYSVPGLIDHVW